MSLLAFPDIWALGEALPAFFWKGLCIHIAVAALLPLTHPRDSRLRYAFLCAALLLCVALLVTDVIRAYGNLSAYRVALPSASAVGYLSVVDTAAWPLWLGAVWLTGVIVMMFRLLTGFAWLRSLVNASVPWDDDTWLARLDAMARHVQLSRTVSLRIVEGLSSPITAGWLKPVVLVPASVITGMPAAFLEALLAHEIAHIKRADYLVNLLQRVAEALLFFHPSVWWLSRRIRIERERIADEMAVALIGNAHQLAHALNALSRMPAPEVSPSLAQRANDGELADRIRRLLRPATPPLRRTLAAPVLAAVFAVAGLAAWGALDVLRASGAADFVRNDVELRDFASIDALVEASGAAHVLLVDSHSGDRLIGRAEHDVVPIASLTKLMTAMVVLDTKPDLTRLVRIDEQDAEATKMGTSQLPVGTVVPLDTLLTLALMSSDNRAAHALARNYPGGLSAFGQAMHRKTLSLGLENTTLEEPTGLASANRSTASDIERISRAVMAYPVISRGTVQASETVGSPGHELQYRNTNPLIGQSGWDIQLSKTAMSASAGRCLVMRIHVRNRDLTLVLLNAQRQPV